MYLHFPLLPLLHTSTYYLHSTKNAVPLYQQFSAEDCFLPFGSIWRQVHLVVTNGGEGATGTQWSRPEMLLSLPHCTGQLHSQENLAQIVNSVEVENLYQAIKTRQNYPPYLWPPCVIPVFLKHLTEDMNYLRSL